MAGLAGYVEEGRLSAEGIARACSGLLEIRERLAALDPGASEKLAALLPVLGRFAQSYAALGAAAKKTVEALLPELAALLEAAEGAMQ